VQHLLLILIGSLPYHTAAILYGKAIDFLSYRKLNLLLCKNIYYAQQDGWCENPLMHGGWSKALLGVSFPFKFQLPPTPQMKMKAP
jgi:hypothetical protein